MHMPTRLLLLTLLLIGPLTAGAQTSPPPESLPLRFFDPDTTTVDEALDLAVNFEITQRAVGLAARMAAETGDPAYIPTLKQILALYADRYRSISYNVLYALWELGEPQSYFLDLAYDWPSDRDRAAQAIKILARDPNDTLYADLQNLAASAHSSTINSALNAYGFTLSQRERLDTLSFAQQYNRILWSLNGVLTAVDVNDEGSVAWFEGDPNGDLGPLVLWARDRMRDLAAQYPAGVYRRLARLSEETDRGIFRPFQHLDPAVLDEIIAGFETYAIDVAFPNGPPPPSCPTTLALIDFLSHPPYALYVDVYNTSATESADLSGCTLARFYFDHQTQERGAAFQVYQADTTLAPGDTLRLGPAAPINPNLPPSGAPQYVSTFALLDLDTLSVGTEASALLPDVFITAIDFLTDTDVYAFDHTDEAVEPRYCQDYAGRLYPGGPASLACE